MNATLRAHAALLLTAIIFAANFTVAKEVMPAWLPPSGFIVLRVVPTALGFWLLHRLTVREPVRRPADRALLALGAALGIAANPLLMFKGLSLTSPINAALLLTLAPVVVLLVAAFWLGERLTTRKVAGTLLSATGAAWLILSNHQAGGGAWAGDLLVVVSSTCYGIYLVLVRPLVQRYHPLTIMKWNFLLGALMVLPFGAADLTRVAWAAMPAYVWACIAFVVVGATLLTYLFNALALRTVHASVAGVYIYLQPPLAAAFAVALDKDVLTWQKGGLGLLILTGVFLAGGGMKRGQKKPATAGTGVVVSGPGRAWTGWPRPGPRK